MIVRTVNGSNFRASPEDPRVDLTGLSLAQLADVMIAGGDIVTGENMTPEKALTGTVAVYACVTLLAGTTGMLPLHTYQDTGPDQRVQVRPGGEGPGPAGWPGRLARLLHSTPNSEMTAQELWEIVVGHGALWGNNFLNVVRGGDGRPSALWPLRPDRMDIRRVKNEAEAARLGMAVSEKYYVYSLPDTGAPVVLRRDEVMHTRWFGTDGLVGLSPLHVGRNAVALEQAMVKFEGGFYSQGAAPSGILTMPADGNQDRARTKANLVREDWQEKTGGLTNAHRTAVLYGGVTWQQTGMPLADAQFVESRGLQITEVARLFGIPPHMVAQVEKSTSWGTGIEQMGLGFLTFTEAPILTRIQGAINRDLGVNPGIRTLRDDGYYAEFAVDALLRTDVKTRYEGYAQLRQWGLLSTNRFNKLENLPPVAGGDDDYIVPANFAFLKDLGAVSQQQAGRMDELLALLVARDDKPQLPPKIVVNNDTHDEIPVSFPQQMHLDMDPTPFREAVEALGEQVREADDRHAERQAEVLAAIAERSRSESDRAAAQHADLVTALAKPPPLVRTVAHRDDKGNLTETVQEYVDEAV